MHLWCSITPTETFSESEGSRQPPGRKDIGLKTCSTRFLYGEEAPITIQSPVSTLHSHSGHWLLPTFLRQMAQWWISWQPNVIIMAFAKEYLFFLITQFVDFLICAVWPTVYKSSCAVTDEYFGHCKLLPSHRRTGRWQDGFESLACTV